MNLIIVQNLPFSIVQWPKFYILCRALNPELIKPSILPTVPVMVILYIKELFID